MKLIAVDSERSTSWCQRCGTLYEEESLGEVRSYHLPTQPEIHGILHWRERAQMCSGLLAFIIGPYRAATREAIQGNVLV